MPSTVRPASRRGVLLLAVFAAILALAAATRALPAARARSMPTQGAQWIWEDMDWRDHDPTAFYAVRDFDLDPPPPRARILISADEEYVLTLNGKRIGAGAYQPGSPLDVYEVGPLLLPGGNRLMAELRSARGTGGLLAALVDGDGRLLVGTDGTGASFPATSWGWRGAGSPWGERVRARPPTPGATRRWGGGAGRGSRLPGRC